MTSFFTELKRRNVFKVGVAYAIVAWLLIQVASIIVPAYQAPGWVMPIFVTLVILGFPIAIFLAWVYELTPEGIKVTASEGPAQFHTRTTGQRLNYFIVGVLVLVVAFVVVDNYVLVDEPGTTTVVSVGSAISSTTTSETEEASSITTPPSTPSAKIRRYAINLGTTPRIPLLNNRTVIALSPDGDNLVYGLWEKNSIQLYHQSLNQLKAQSLPVGGINPTFSPDEEWLVYGFINTLYKVSIAGGSPQALAERITLNRGIFWSEDDVIYFIKENKLHRIAATGGTPEPVNITSELADWNHYWPYGLPGGTHLLLTASTAATANQGITALLSLDTGETQVLIQNSYNARYVPTGHIVFVRTGSLWAVPFDVGQLKITGPEVPVINGVETQIDTGITPYAFSNDGLLVYLPGDEVSRISTGELGLVWVDRSGLETQLQEMPLSNGGNAAPRLSPDGKQVAVGVSNQTGMDIWTYDFERGTFSRRTFAGDAEFAIWTPDGKRLIYGHDTSGQLGLSWSRADGSGQPERLVDSTTAFFPDSFSPDGSQLVIRNVINSNTVHLHVMSMTGEHKQKPLIATEFMEFNGEISPDGHWIAYGSFETGQEEVYVRPYPDVENGKWQISTDGGIEPRWRSDGKVLFFALWKPTDGTIKGIGAVTIDTESGFQPGKQEVLFTGNYVRGFGRSYDVTADGQRFIMMKHTDINRDDIEAQLISLVAVDNWFDELKRLALPTP